MRAGSGEAEPSDGEHEGRGPRSPAVLLWALATWAVGVNTRLSCRAYCVLCQQHTPIFGYGLLLCQYGTALNVRMVERYELNASRSWRHSGHLLDLAWGYSDCAIGLRTLAECHRQRYARVRYARNSSNCQWRPFDFAAPRRPTGIPRSRDL